LHFSAEKSSKEEAEQKQQVNQFPTILTVQNIADGASLNETRASPKSHIFSLQSALARIFFGFKSRWNTFAVRKQLFWFNITIWKSQGLNYKYTCVYEFEASKKLVQEKLIVLRAKIIICLNHLMKIRLHQLKHNIDIPELSSWGRKHYMLDLDYIRMSKQTEEFDFS